MAEYAGGRGSSQGTRAREYSGGNAGWSADGLEDLRIIDSTESQVPYLIERLLPEPESTIRPSEFRSIIENGALHLILKTGTSAPIIGVSLETPATRFMKAADVEGSNDGRTWIKLAGGDSLFQLPNGATKLRVSVPEGAWQFLRVTIDELGAPPVPFTGAHVHKARTTAPAEAVAVTIKSAGRKSRHNESRSQSWRSESEF